MVLSELGDPPPRCRLPLQPIGSAISILGGCCTNSWRGDLILNARAQRATQKQKVGKNRAAEKESCKSARQMAGFLEQQMEGAQPLCSPAAFPLSQLANDGWERNCHAMADQIGGDVGNAARQ